MRVSSFDVEKFVSFFDTKNTSVDGARKIIIEYHFEFGCSITLE